MARGDKTARAGELARELGVSQRTAWRWLARQDGLEPEDVLWRQCRGCGEPLPVEATIRRKYCDSTCRVYAYRARKHAEERAIHRGRLARRLAGQAALSRE